jgi:hypothetical protein
MAIFGLEDARLDEDVFQGHGSVHATAQGARLKAASSWQPKLNIVMSHYNLYCNET